MLLYVSLSECITVNAAIRPLIIAAGIYKCKACWEKNILLETHCSSACIFYSPPLEMSHKMKMKYERNQYQSVFFFPVS